MLKSDSLSEGFIFGEDKGALDLLHKGEACVCELAIYTAQKIRGGSVSGFECFVAVPLAQLALEDCKCEAILNSVCQRERESERAGQRERATLI